MPSYLIGLGNIRKFQRIENVKAGLTVWEFHVGKYNFKIG